MRGYADLNLAGKRPVGWGGSLLIAVSGSGTGVSTVLAGAADSPGPAGQEGASGYWVAAVLAAGVVVAAICVQLWRKNRRLDQRLAKTAADLWDRRQGYERLQRSLQEAETANQAKSRFLASIGEVIRSPMNETVRMAEAALESDVDPAGREQIERVRQMAFAVMTSINDVLDYCAMEAGKLTLTEMDFSLRHCVESTLERLKATDQAQGLDVISQVNPEVPDRLVGDAGRLREVLAQLVGNAIKYTDSGRVAVGVETESRQEDSVTLRFTITDTGAGIPADKLESIFEPFTQAASRSNRSRGLGLGLTVAAQLVHLMGGRIEVESRVGQGSTFRFCGRFGLQCGRSQDRSGAMGRPNLTDLPVLVVDVNQVDRSALAEKLSRWDLRPAEAAEAREAMEAIKRAADGGNPFGLVLVDACLPDIDGFALAEIIKKDTALGDPIVFILTSAGRRGEAGRCQAAGVSAYLTEPFADWELWEAIETAMAWKDTRPAAPLITRHSLRENRRTLRVLFAGEGDSDQAIGPELLKSLGYSVRVATDWTDALQTFNTQRFDLAVFHLETDDDRGLETVATIRKQERITGQPTPIVAIAAPESQSNRERYRQAGVDRCVFEPVRRWDLLDAIDQALYAEAREPAEFCPV